MYSKVHVFVTCFCRLPHWDVNNENVHGDFYAQKLHDPDITVWMFNEAHNADPNSLLFLNDYNVVSQNEATVVIIPYLLPQIQVYILGFLCYLTIGTTIATTVRR